MKKSDLPDGFKHFRLWMEEGSVPLDEEMADALGGPKEAGEEDSGEPAWITSDARFEHRSLGSRFKNMNKGVYYAYYSIVAVLVCAGLIGVLLFATVRMPKFGGAKIIENSKLTEFYVKNTLKDTGSLNIVTGIILFYRGFDTLGESHVLFAAVCTVLILLHFTEDDEKEQEQERLDDRHFEPRNDLILQTMAQLVVPCVLMFGVYVVLNGHLSPGGGFSGGSVIGCGLILYLCAYGYGKTERFMNEKVFKNISAFALIFYTVAKGYHFITAFNKIPNKIGIGKIGSVFSGGLLLPLNIAVGCIVSMTMYTLYTMFRKGDF